ncbi:MAG: hypothetical protein J0L92_01875 [Deltaproteobacteria bacterium]|nr:hypothetical protein [Deltaproteobacteria bacterium]
MRSVALIGSRALAGLFLLLSLAAIGCGGPMSIRSFTQQAPPQPRIAIVSVTVGDQQGALQGWNAARTSDVMVSRAGQMVQVAEQVLATRFTVVPAASFVANPQYQSVPSYPADVGVPVINGTVMPVFGSTRGEVNGAVIGPAQAQALCAATGADFVVVIHSEWGVITGRMVPTSKALATTTMSIFDSTGVHVARTRLQDRGERTLGAFGGVVVDDNSIDEWVRAYGTSLARMMQ